MAATLLLHHVRHLLLLGLAVVGFCGNAPEAAVPEASEPAIDGDVAPQGEMSPSATTPMPAAATEDAGAKEAASSRLRTLLTDMRLGSPSELLEEAMKLRSGGEGSHWQRPRSARPLLEALAAAAEDPSVPRENSTSAMRELGNMYLRGEGVTADVLAAVAHYERAANQGDADSQHALGVILSTGFGAGRDTPLAATYLYFAAEGGSIGAQLALGYRHLLGVSAPKACHKSLLYYSPVAERVVANAQVRVWHVCARASARATSASADGIGGTRADCVQPACASSARLWRARTRAVPCVGAGAFPIPLGRLLARARLLLTAASRRGHV